jgi:hypothetical protein
MKDVATATPARKSRPARKAAGPAPSAKKAARRSRAIGSGTVSVEAAPTSAAVARTTEKLVRDSFTMPRSDLRLIEQLKARAIAFHRPAKKSELLRAGLHALAVLTDEQLRAGLDALTPLKPGRPKKPA